MFEDGELKPVRAKDHGFTHRLNAQWKPQENLMFYATWSRGFRPGGINRRVDVPPYDADFLTNYELGWKTTFGPLRWNGAIFHENWKKFQFAFLGENSFTEIHNARDARINGLETDLSYVQRRPDAERGGRLHGRQDQGEHLQQVRATQRRIARRSFDGLDDFIVAPSGTRLPITPKFKATATARYSWPVLADVKAHVQGERHLSRVGSVVAPNADRARPGRQRQFPEPERVPGKAALGDPGRPVRGLDWQKWNIEAFATNLFDKRIDISRQTACGSCTRALVVPGRPRTFGLRAGMKF